MSTDAIPVDSDTIISLRRAIKDCTERGLSHASKWAAELLASVPLEKKRAVPKEIAFASTPSRPPQSRSPLIPNPPSTTSLHIDTGGVPVPQIPATNVEDIGARMAEMDIETNEEDLLSQGRACFDSKEFLHASHLLSKCSSVKGQFLGLYARYLASEKQALRDWNKMDGDRNQPTAPVNVLLSQLYECAAQISNTDPWILFIRGLLLYRIQRREESIECTIRSIERYPWNWSAWTLLTNLVNDGEELAGLIPLIPLPPTHPLVQFFHIKTLNVLHQPSENEIDMCDKLLAPDYFPNSLWIMSMRATALYHLHDFGQAEIQFKKILELDPYRVDDIDIYSNILYVTEDRLRLSKLAHEFLTVDKDRPEVCCLVGNHYSLRAEHDKAIKYFRRATQLDPTYLSAWTLMGHEYVEMKNSHAAIEAYRIAVEVNRKDYRAWYGLGQAYELLNMHQYALHYFQHATSLRPYDVRLWQAQAASYEEMGRLREAVECYKRALLGADVNESTISLKLAKLYDDLKEQKEAADYHMRVIHVCRATQKMLAEYAKSCIYVARFQFQTGGDLDLAKDLLDKVAGSNAEDANEAAELVKKVNAAIVAQVGATHEESSALDGTVVAGTNI